MIFKATAVLLLSMAFLTSCLDSDSKDDDEKKGAANAVITVDGVEIDLAVALCTESITPSVGPAPSATFNWTAVPDAAEYAIVHYAVDGEFEALSEDLIVESQITTDTQYVIPDMGTLKHRVDVYAIDADDKTLCTLDGFNTVGPIGG